MDKEGAGLKGGYKTGWWRFQRRSKCFEMAVNAFGHRFEAPSQKLGTLRPNVLWCRGVALVTSVIVNRLLNTSG